MAAIGRAARRFRFGLLSATRKEETANGLGCCWAGLDDKKAYKKMRTNTPMVVTSSDAMRCIISTLSSIACSLLRRSTNHGPLISNEDRFDGTKQTNGGAYPAEGGGGTDVESTTGGAAQVGKDKDPSFVLPLLTGGVILLLLCGLWFWWRWHKRRAGTVDWDWDWDGIGDGGRMNGGPAPKLWEVEVHENVGVGGGLRVSVDEAVEVEDYRHKVGKVRVLKLVRTRELRLLRI
jgi:hypothetical protein